MNKKNKVINAFNKAATTYNQYAWLQCKVGRELLYLTSNIGLEPKLIIDVGCGTGTQTAKLARLFNKSKSYGIDIASNMIYMAKQNYFKNKNINFIIADADNLPFRCHSVDLIFSNLMLQWSDNLKNTLNEFANILKPKGYLIFSIVGPNTFWELRKVCLQNNWKINHKFLAAKNILNILKSEKFICSHFFSKKYLGLYASFNDFLHEMKFLGVNHYFHSNSGLCGKNKLYYLQQGYEQFRTNNKLIATYEIYYFVVKMIK